jgi:Rieske Fe-S protein
VIAGAAGVGIVAALSACGSSNSGAASGGNSASPSQVSTDPNNLGKAADVPVGGGKVFDAQKVVVTQPTAGTFKGFSAMCTHMGCTVASVSNGIIQCPCHGSQYSATDGSVQHGPAPKALAAKAVTVKGQDLYLA